MNTDLDQKLKIIAMNIRSHRKEQGKSQWQLAKKLSITQNAYSKMEMGKTKITLQNFMIIADYLKINTADLLNNPQITT